jgi:uncharacterized membrane protein YgcG
MSATKVMLGAIASIIGTGTAISVGSSSGSVEGAWTVFLWFCTVFLPLSVGGLVIDHTKNRELQRRKLAKQQSLTAIAKKYNEVTNLLESEYRLEKKSLGRSDKNGKENLRRRYEQLYLQNKKAYEQERVQFLNSFEQDSPVSKRFKKNWKKFIAAGLFTQLMACGYTVGAMPDDTPTTTQAVQVASGDSPSWNAETIPMPHLTDGSRYVSNPDHVVTANTETLLNHWLKRLDDSLQIESAMIIVNHVENEDPFRFAQDIFDKYKVGKNDRGLVVVLAYQDHKVRTHTGRALEADLTDIECSRLQQTYAIPFMKAEQPDSGMLYLTEAIYNTLQKKDLPLTYSQQKESESDELAGIIALYLILFGAWAFLIAYLFARYKGFNGFNLLRANPFAEASAAYVSGGGYIGGSSRSSSSRSFGGGGGGFSGGSSGGGGATSSW